MFTGLVQQVGRLERISFQGDAGRLALAARFDSPLQIGESIAVNGACLTLVEQRGEILVFDVLRETFDKTALRDKAPGAPLNLGTSIIASVVLGIVTDDTIHLMSRLSAEIKASADQNAAMLRTFSSVGKPALYNSALLFFGFASLATSTFVPLQQFGILSAITILAAILTELALFPALLATTRIITLWDLLGVKLGKDPHKTIPLFADLRPSQARLVALLAGLESYPPGAAVVRQGDIGDQMFVIIDGKAQVVVEAGGERRHVRDFGRGDVFGEMGLIRSNERTADVVADGPLEVMTVDQRALARVQRRYPRTAAQIFLNLSKILSDRLQRETARV